MSDTKTHDEAPAAPNSPAALAVAVPTAEEERPAFLGTTRRRLILVAIGLVAVSLVLTFVGSAGGALGAVLWGSVGVFFLGALVVGLMESGARRSLEQSRSEAGDPLATDGSDVVDAKPLLTPGNPLRPLRGGITAAIGAIGAFVLMAVHGHAFLIGSISWSPSVPLGIALCIVCVWGLMDLMGTFDDADERIASTHALGDLRPSILRLAGSLLAFCLAIAFAARGLVIPQWAWGFVVTATFLWLVAEVFRAGVKLGPWAADEAGASRPLLHRHGFWVLVAAAVLYFPMMGAYSLWDPWETHYGEVSREILARDDWISLWWSQDGWFFSKPILDFWIQAISMATLGLHYMPDKMLIGDGTLPTMHPEWIVRTPVVLMTIVAMYLLYKGVAKAYGRRAALLGAFVLATMPDWWFLAHQTMTDMPCVAALTAAMGLLLLGLHTDGNETIRVYEVRAGSASWRISAWHIVLGLIALTIVPQILYLFSRNLDILWKPGAHGFHPHWDEFWSGSGGGNCGLPGNEACTRTLPASIPKSVGASPDGFVNGIIRTFGAFEPFLQGLLWSGVLAVIFFLNWGERRTRRLLYLGAWFFASVATMAKGPEGIALPAACALVYLVARGQQRDIMARIKALVGDLTQLEIPSGTLVFLAMVLPWWVAMYVRHGTPFTDRLIFHDMFNRALHHVHDTNEGDDTSFRFYVWQLGYATFPWTGLAPLGLLYWLRRGDMKQKRRADTAILLSMWFLFTFALFSYMGTKFHHYIFPSVPPIAMLIGVALDDMLGERPLVSASGIVPYVLGIGGGALLAVFGLAKMWPGSVFGVRPDPASLTPASPYLGGALILVGIAMVFLFARMFRAKRDASPDVETKTASHASTMYAGVGIAAAFVLAVVGRDLAMKSEAGEGPGAIRLLQLFTYNYKRLWPDSLDFGAVLTAFAVASVVISIAIAWKKIRAHAVMLFAAVSFVWAVWGIDVYMAKTAPHWGQHEVIAAYYANRATPDEELVAYQMNWKGENFYTGNHIPAFVSTGSSFTSWIKKKKDEGAKVMFFVTEHSRIGGLKNEVGAKSYRELTTKEICNKFVLIRAEF
jgi:4-amino-4-deoxy-L-arabinose transferase-like glycosyltransferase